jgi:hypothetical protein
MDQLANHPHRELTCQLFDLSLSPAFFDADNFKSNNVDRTIRSRVSQDHGDIKKVSDWFKLCRLDRYSASAIDSVDFFLDNTESLPTNHIPKSLAKFKADCATNGLAIKEVAEVAGYKESWIMPFMPGAV